MRKGVLYSIFTLFLIIPIVMLVITYSNVLKVEGSNMALRVRADSMKYFYDSTSDDLERVLQISARRAVLHLTNEVLTSGMPAQNSEQKLSEMIINGTMGGEDVPQLKGTEDFPCNTVQCWIDATEYISSTKFGYSMSIYPESVQLMPYDSWDLKVLARVRIHLSDEYMNLSMNTTLSKVAIIPIFGMDDTLYPLNTNGKISSFVQKSAQPPIVTGTTGNGWAAGEASTTFDLANASRKIFVTSQNLDSLELSELNSFAGVVSSSGPAPSGLTTPFILLQSTSNIPSGRKIYFDNITLGVWDLNADIQGGFYHASSQGPSFLDRLEGRNYISPQYISQSSADIGLLSFVDLGEFASSGLDYDPGKSCVDYIYFGGSGGNPC